MKTYKDIYKFPLIPLAESMLSYPLCRIYDSSNNFVFQFHIEGKKEQQDILDVINNKKNFTNPDLKFKHEKGGIHSVEDGKEPMIILIRGWGNLIGTGAHNLPAEEAANIQDTFAEYIVERLNFRE